MRQVVLVAPELGPALEEVRDGLGIEPCFHDPGVAEFGLENVLFPIGHQFLEIVAPVPSGWHPRGVARRFEKVFGQPLLVVANESVTTLAPAPDHG